MAKIYVLGMGPGSKDYILPITTKIIHQCDVLIGGKRNLQYFENLEKEILYIGSNLKEIVEYTKNNKDEKKIAFLLSGDTGFYSMLSYLKKYFSEEDLEVIPGISAYQYLAGRIGQSWQDAYVGSLHGRNFNFIEIVKEYKKVFVLTDQKNSPREIARELIQHDMKDRIMIVGENLSYDDEKITIGKTEDIIKMKDFSMSVVVIKDEMDV
ncbi:precorrin-6y C5,15-methyltransferase (decarboxylating) subunit CbiE [Lutibacter sp. B2]|nr:precorrin-6y C5,15-methyltransferase (decarboxylating) subunit CbiE [Lutibacter sp. B2]